MDEDDFDDIGSFNSEQEALIEAQQRVKNEIINLWSTGTKIEKLIDSWLSFGQDPTIRCTDPNINAPFFSGRNYAETVVEELTKSLQDNREDIQSIYQATILFASEKHAKINQMIPGTSIPYAVHLSNVSMEILLASQMTANFNLKLAMQTALLHDTLEDTDTTENELEEKFGIAIPACVKALTKNTKLQKDQQMADSLSRIKKMPFEIWAVKLADRITNLQPPPKHWNTEKKIKYLEEAKAILKELNKGNEYLAKRLETKIQEYQIYITN
jgi:guanosine-3',5'-bis(diphosphate) 3'-pyrophosphohydrolase